MKSRLLNHSIAACAVISLLLSADTIASEGVIEINQAAALAGGITPSDAPGFPVTLDQPGSYRLTGNLDFTTISEDPFGVTGIVITAEDVSLDLGGFSVSVGDTNPVPELSRANPISIESDNVYIHDGALIVSEGSDGSSGSGRLRFIERVRFEGSSGEQGGAHGAFRQSSSSVYLWNLASGLAIGNEGAIFIKQGLVLDHVASNQNVYSYGDSVLVVGSRMNQLGTLSSGYTAYGRNVIPGGLTGSGIGNAFQIGTNVCGTDTTCP
jgi:hypothetical protein